MSIGQGTQTNSGASSPTPTAYAPVSTPNFGPGPIDQLREKLMANPSGPLQVGTSNPFALGGRAPGDYAPAPAQQPMSVIAPNGGFPPPAPAAPSGGMQPRYGGFMGGMMRAAPDGGITAPGMGRGGMAPRGIGAR